MTGTLHKTSGLVRHRIVFLVGEWSQRMICRVNTIGIHLKFGSGSAILEIVFAVVLIHVTAFGKRRQRRAVVVVHAEAFPSMQIGFQHRHVNNFAFRVKIAAVQFNSFQGKFVARSVIHI